MIVGYFGRRRFGLRTPGEFVLLSRFAFRATCVRYC